MRVLCYAEGSQKIKIYYTVSNNVELFDESFDEAIATAVMDHTDVELLDWYIIKNPTDELLVPEQEYCIEIMAKVSMRGTCNYYRGIGEIEDVDLHSGLIEDIDTDYALVDLLSIDVEVASIDVEIGELYDFDNLKIDEDM